MGRNTSEEGMKSIKMAAEVGFDSISATAGCQESPAPIITRDISNGQKGQGFPACGPRKGHFGSIGAKGQRFFS